MAQSTVSGPKPAATHGRTGGTEGNARLTGSTGALLVVLLLIEGVTLLSLSSLLPLHLFIGIVLIPPVLLKATSTGYRFVRYYTRNTPYVAKGPPPLLLRALGPVILLSTGVLLTTGVALLAIGPGDGLVRNLHTWSFIVFAGAVSVHVLAHLRNVPALTAADWRPRTRLPGASGRRALLLASLLVGLAFGSVAVSFDGSWVHRAHDHRFEDSRR